jgi:ligand-binding sensor domain-containing protein
VDHWTRAYRAFIWPWLAILSCPPSAAAQGHFDVWTVQDGLPQSSVNDIQQTRDGYLWLATYGGLVRFDGVRFVVFDRATPGVRSLRILALHEDRAGTLWAGTDDGMLLRYRDGRFTTFDRSNGFAQRASDR